MAGLSRTGLRHLTQPLLCRISSSTAAASTRLYGSSAAAMQNDYYYDDEEEEECVSETRSRVADDEEREVQWVVIGDPRTKKHLYAEKLSNVLEVPLVSMGTLLRQELSPRSSLYKQISNAVNEGKLVPEDVIFGLLSKRLEEGYYRGEKGFILGGIPRTRNEAEILDQIADIDLVVNFKCAEEQLVKNNLLSPGNIGSSVAADPSSALKEKFQLYAEQGKALEDYYRKQKKLLDFQVGGSPGETWQRLLAALRLKHVAAASASPMLAV